MAGEFQRTARGLLVFGIITLHLCVFQSQDMGFQYHMPWLFSETGWEVIVRFGDRLAANHSLK